MSRTSGPRVLPDLPLADDVILLRPPSAADIPAIAAACADPEIARWVPVPVPYTAADAATFVEIAAEGWASGGDATFAIVQRRSGQLAGMIGLHPGGRPTRAAVGYWLAPGARGRGLATRAVRLLAGWAFEDPVLERLELVTLVGNDASGRVALRAGFRREGVLRRYLAFRDATVDAVMYALVRDDLEQERLASVGTLAAGLAHELSNAAAAARSTAARLGEALDEWDRASAALGAHTTASEPAGGGVAAAALIGELLDALREQVAERADDPPVLDPLDEADRRDAVAALLADLGMADPTEPAAALVALGWDGNEIDDLLTPFGTDEARLVVVAWLCASAVVRLLLAELGIATAQISAILAAGRECTDLDRDDRETAP